MSKIKRALPEDYSVFNKDGINQILIWEPRWHDRTVLIAERKIMDSNEVIIQHKDFPKPFYLSGRKAKEFPLEQMGTKAGGTIAVRAIPISELEKEEL